MKAADVLLGLAYASHPFPLAAVVFLTALIGLASLDSGKGEPWRLLIAIVAMLCAQLAIGWSNDYLDRDRDRRYRPSKPIVRGLIEARWLPILVLAACLAATATGLILGLLPLLLLVVGTSCGLGYNLRIKDTSLSWLPYLIAFAMLPLFVWAALDSFRTDFLWLYVFGVPLALAVHVANTLPDVETDRLSGHVGFVARMKSTSALVLLGACLVSAVVLLAAGSIYVDFDDPNSLFAGLGGYGFLIAGATLAYRRSTPRWAFKMISVACIVLTVSFVGSV